MGKKQVSIIVKWKVFNMESVISIRGSAKGWLGIRGSVKGWVSISGSLKVSIMSSVTDRVSIRV